MEKNSPSQSQRIITALAASILVFYLWLFVYNKFFYTPPTQPTTTATAPADGATTRPATAPERWPQGEQPTTRPEAGAMTSSNGLRVEGGQDTADLMLGNAESDSVYPMALELSPRGAAVKNAWIRGFYQTVKKEKPYQIFQPVMTSDGGPMAYSLVTSKVRFVNLDQEVALDELVWKKEAVGEQHVTFSVTVRAADGKQIARILKTYSLPPQPPKKGTAGETFDLFLTTRIENLTGGQLQTVLIQQGPLGFQMESRTEDRKIIGAVFQAAARDSFPAVKGHLRTELVKNDLVELGRDDQEHRIAWVAEANQYFTCIMAPLDRMNVDAKPLFDRAEATHLSQRTEGSSEDLTFRYVTRPLTIEAGQSQDVGFDCYIGPKSKKIFQSTPKYEKRNYFAVITEGFYMCAPTILVTLMMNLLNAFHAIPPHNYGVAIFLLVVLVRGILHPITKRSQVNMMKMQKQMSALQPKINAAKEKYANDRTAMNQAIMEVYRDAGINPAGNMLTCIPMMLQLPIWAALWAALSSTVEMRHAPLDGWWIKDLTQPDAVITFSQAFNIPLVSYIMGGPVHSLNLLPILLGISQLLQAKYMPRSSAPSTSDNPDQMEQQRKMMMFMSIFFFFMFYNMPSGLNLYIMTSNIAGILEQWRIRKHIAEEEKKGPPPPSAPKAKGFLQRKWEELQKEAEAAKQLQSERKKKGK